MLRTKSGARPPRGWRGPQPSWAAGRATIGGVSGNGRGWPYEPVGGPPEVPPSAPSIEGPAFVPPAAAEPAISRRAVVLLSIAGAVALVLASVGVGDWWVRNRELQVLLGRVERAERAQIPAIQGIGRLLDQCEQAAGDEDGLCDTVSIRAGAERALPQLRSTGDEVAGTRLTSFHGSLRTFRDSYVDHNLAWRSWLETLADDPTAGGFEAPSAIGTTFEDASRAADAALTPLPLYGNQARIETIFLSVR